MRETILAQLSEIERAHQVTILYACESGSRGWQFASKDSDYDVRFIYLHRLDWYLSIFDKRDVIELPIVDQLDMVGWDFRKSLKLLQRSNPRLLEWISSPIVYVSPHGVIEQMWALAPSYFSAYVCGQHHIRAARFYFEQAIQEEKAHVKWLFYTLRSVLVLKWIEETHTISPMSFWTRADRLISDAALRQAIQALFIAKQQSAEQSFIPRMPVLEQFCAQEIARLNHVTETFAHTVGPDQPLDDLFRAAVLSSQG